MGLFSKLTGAMPAKKATDDVLLMHAMLLMAGADGVLERSELSTVEAFYMTLPEFEGKAFGDVLAQVDKVVARFGNLKDSIKALGEIQSEAVRKKCFVLAADLALSSGDVDPTEEQMLEAMQRILNVDDATATKVLEVLALKYAQ